MTVLQQCLRILEEKNVGELKDPNYYRKLSRDTGNTLVEQDILATPQRRIWVSSLTILQGAHENNPVRVDILSENGCWKLAFLSGGNKWFEAGKNPQGE